MRLSNTFLMGVAVATLTLSCAWNGRKDAQRPASPLLTAPDAPVPVSFAQEAFPRRDEGKGTGYLQDGPRSSVGPDLWSPSALERLLAARQELEELRRARTDLERLAEARQHEVEELRRELQVNAEARQTAEQSLSHAQAQLLEAQKAINSLSAAAADCEAVRQSLLKAEQQIAQLTREATERQIELLKTKQELVRLKIRQVRADLPNHGVQ